LYAEKRIAKEIAHTSTLYRPLLKGKNILQREFTGGDTNQGCKEVIGGDEAETRLMRRRGSFISVSSLTLGAPPPKTPPKPFQKKMAAQIVDGWFSEKEEEALWPGQRFSLKLAPGNKVLHTEKSEYQDIVVFDTATYGRCLVLDGAIQVTTRDEFAYQEMIAHVPLFAHPNPKAVLIVGGGDGGVAREVCKHPGLEKVRVCARLGWRGAMASLPTLPWG
jgi:hypothetical protein